MSLDNFSHSKAHQVLAPYQDQITMLTAVMLWANRGDGNGNAPFDATQSVYGLCAKAVSQIVQHVTGLDISSMCWNLGGNESVYWDVVALVQNTWDTQASEEAGNQWAMLDVSQSCYDRCVRYILRIRRWKMETTESPQACDVFHVICGDVAAMAIYQTSGAKYRVARGLFDEVRDYFKDDDWRSEESNESS